MRIEILNLAPVRVGNYRAVATVRVGPKNVSSFAVWRGPEGDFVQGAPMVIFSNGVPRVGPPAHTFDRDILQAVERDLLTLFRMEWDDVEPFVPQGEPSDFHPSVKTAAENCGIPHARDESAVQPKCATSGASEAPRLNENAENERLHTCVEPPTEAQTRYARGLGHTGAMPASKAGVSQLIERLKNEKAEREAREKAAQPAMGF